MQYPITKRLRMLAAGMVLLTALSTLYSFSEGKRLNYYSQQAINAAWAAHSAAALISPVPTGTISFFDEKKSLFDSLELDQFGLSRHVYELALKGMTKLRLLDKVQHNILTIVDFSKPSTTKRLFVIDLDLGQLLFNTWVAHGRNSGQIYAQNFSNKPRSKKSSLGFYVTGSPYIGSNGYSLKLLGVEPGVNSLAAARGIVIHGANYVSENQISSQGYLGRSQGCPAVAPEINDSLIETIKEGSCLFIYHPTASYIHRSSLLR